MFIFMLFLSSLYRFFARPPILAGASRFSEHIIASAAAPPFMTAPTAHVMNRAAFIYEVPHKPASLPQPAADSRRAAVHSRAWARNAAVAG